MSFFDIWFQSLMIILTLMTILWLISIIVRNVSIVDFFWGLGFVITAAYFFLKTGGNESRKILLMILVIIWGLRLSIYLVFRNAGKGEDFRYRKFRKNYGEKRYWWISFFQTFLLQGILMWLIAAPLLGAQYYGHDKDLNILDLIGIFFWVTGFIFEAGGDYQLAVFKRSPANKGKVLSDGLWKYTRHPNYFGDSSVWWGYGFICLAAGSYLPVLGSLIMTALIIKVSGVALLERSMSEQKPVYKEYMRRTSAFIPWFPRKQA